MDSLLECGSLWDLVLDHELPCLQRDLDGFADLSREYGSDEFPAVSVSKPNCLPLTEALVLSRGVCCSTGFRSEHPLLQGREGAPLRMKL